MNEDTRQGPAHAASGLRVCLIAAFSGRLPVWMPLFLQSVAANPCIDFFLVGDFCPDGLPDNAKFHRMALSEIDARARQVIHPEARVAHAYKLCDYKPAYALLFPEIVAGYDFWGYSDIDLVFGSLAEVVSEAFLRDCDMYFADAHMVMAHFTLLRNDPQVNRVILEIPQVVQHLAEYEYKSVDETLLEQYLRSSRKYRVKHAQQLSQSQLTVTAEGRMMGQTSGVLGKAHEFFYRNGRCFIQGAGFDAQEVLYLHFMGLKRSYHWRRYDPANSYPEFAFSAAGFLPWVTPPTRMAALGVYCRALWLRQVFVARALVAKWMPTQARLRLKEWLRRR